jgi:hypothetical protein
VGLKRVGEGWRQSARARQWRSGWLSVALMSAVLVPLSAPAGGSSPSGAAQQLPRSDCTPASVPAAQADGGLDRTFASEVGPGWVGGDATYSTELPDGREDFVFSDTLIGTAGVDGNADISGIAHNSELYGSLSGLRANYAGTFATPQPLIPDDSADGDQWQVAATYVENGSQLVFVNEFAPTGGMYTTFTGRSGIAVMTIGQGHAPSYRAVVTVPTDPQTQWGNAAVQDGRYTYVYGSVSASPGTFSGMKLARVRRGATLDARAWQYWNGMSFVTGEDHALTIPTGNELTGVVAQDGTTGYAAVSIPASVFTDTTVDLSFACSPEGPWTAPVSVYSIPQVGISHQIAYMPTFHTELSGDDGLVISYNVNTTDGLTPLDENIHGYQPHFVLLRHCAWGRSTDPPPAETPEAPMPLLFPLATAGLIAGVVIVRRRRARRAPARQDSAGMAR